MTISVDRRDGTFTPELSDKINTMSNELYESIAALPTPDLDYKEDVENIHMDIHLSNIRENSIRIGHLYVINFIIPGTWSSSEWVEVGDLPVPCPIDIITPSGDGRCLWKVNAGSRTLYGKTFGTSPTPDCYFYYSI